MEKILKKVGQVRVGLRVAHEGFHTIIYLFEAFACCRYQYRAKRNKKITLLYGSPLKNHVILFLVGICWQQKNITSENFKLSNFHGS